jgi:4-carboxymuconolactone decarboxylase
MTPAAAGSAIVGALDDATRLLVRLAATITAGEEREMRGAMELAVDAVPPAWVEELILQSYLFAGFPRGLNAAREWRRISGQPAPAEDEGTRLELAEEWRARGEATCSTVYGRFYEKLRANIRTLHPALDSWMIVEGYGKVLGRPGLDLARRELCIVAACAAARQTRQLHSHLHGALHAGASPAQVEGTLDAIEDLVGREGMEDVRALWRKVVGQR